MLQSAAMRTRLLALLALPLFACAPQSPEKRQWPTYSKAATNILGEYDQAMNGVASVDLALVAPNPPPKGGIQPMNNDQAVAELEKTVIPALNTAAAEANGIEFKTDSSLARLHQMLVQGLALKAEAYKSLVNGYKAKNAEMFDQGVAKLSQGDVLMGNFRSCFQDGVMNGAPPRCNTAIGGAPQQTQQQAVATPSGLPGVNIPGMH